MRENLAKEAHPGSDNKPEESSNCGVEAYHWPS